MFPGTGMDLFSNAESRENKLLSPSARMIEKNEVEKLSGHGCATTTSPPWDFGATMFTIERRPHYRDCNLPRLEIFMSPSLSPENSERSSPLWNALGVVCFLIVLGMVYLRLTQLMLIPGEPLKSDQLGRMGLADFQDVVYYPARALADRVNPYDAGTTPLSDGSPRYRQRYPVLNLFPLYSPMLFLLYWPFACFSFTTSAWLYVIFNVGLLLLFAYLCWRWAGIRPSVGSWFLLAALMLATQAGRANFLGGETAIALALVSAAAALAQSQLGGAFFLTLASFKPTFGLPLGILLLAAGHVRTVLLGWTAGFVVAVTGLLVIFAWQGDWANMPRMLRENQAVAESDPDWSAHSSPIRVDSAGALEKLTPFLQYGFQYLSNGVIFGLACWGLHCLKTLRHLPEAARISFCIITLTTVSCMYHIIYDAMLLWCPIVCLVSAPASVWRVASARWRWSLAALVSLPMFNIFGTQGMVNLWKDYWPTAFSISPNLQTLSWNVICTANGLSLLTALIGLVVLAVRIQQTYKKEV
jgi:Glycosyltransferase family 87